MSKSESQSEASRGGDGFPEPSYRQIGKFIGCVALLFAVQVPIAMRKIF